MADVFISYCRDDEAYLNRLLLTLLGYDLSVCDTCWSGRDQPDEDRQAALQEAVGTARLAILMVTPSFLAVPFIKQHELPLLLARAAAGTLTLVPIPVRPVDWQAQKFSLYPAPLDPKEPLARLVGANQDDAYVVIGQFIVAALDRSRARAAAQLPTAVVSTPDPVAEELARLLRQRQALTEQIMETRRRQREGRLPRQGDILCDRYALDLPLGSGGFAAVWRAMDQQLNRQVALKLLHGQYSEEQTRRERFFRGARKMASLQHEGIVTVLEQACNDGQVYFYVMEYLPGGDLETAVLRGEVPREEWLPVLLQAGAALQYAHDQGLIHRDIKPSNILLDRERRARLSDFDLVRGAQSTAGTRDGLGSFVYAAPECLDNGADGDVRADVFGLGMTFIFALAGKKLPFEALRNAPGFIRALGLSKPLAQALIKAVALDREQRTATVDLFCRELQAALGEPGVPYQGHSRAMPSTAEKGEAQDQSVDSDHQPSPRIAPAQRRMASAPVYVPRKPTNSRRFRNLLALCFMGLAVGLLAWKLVSMGQDPAEPGLQVTPSEKSAETAEPQDPGPAEIQNGDSAADRTKATPPEKGVEIAKQNAQLGEEVRRETGGVQAKPTDKNVDMARPQDPGPAEVKNGDSVADSMVVTPLENKVTETARPPWAVASGSDNYGTWAEIEVKGFRARLRWIPPGRFRMGSPADEAGRYSNEHQHPVTLTQGYWLGETEVTQGLWQAVMTSNPSHFKGVNLPVEMVSWDDAIGFVKQLNQRVPGLALRLPTEAEWEYACRAGTATPFSFGQQMNSSQVNFDGRYPYKEGAKSEYRASTVEVKSLPGNAWGLYEMHGNVREWCADVYGPYSGGAVQDPQGPAAGARRVMRGGSWGDDRRGARAACRGTSGPGERRGHLGFRLARGQ